MKIEILRELNAEREARSDQRGEAGRESLQHRADRPQRDRPEVGEPDAESIQQDAAGNLRGRVGPRECREGEAHQRGVQTELMREQWGRHADHGAIEAGKRMGLERILHGHRHRNRPPRLADEFRIVDVNVPIDQQDGSPLGVVGAGARGGRSELNHFCPPMIACSRVRASGGVAIVRPTTCRTSSPRRRR